MSPLVSLWLCAALSGAPTPLDPPEEAPPARVLAVDEVVEREISPQDVHAYRLELLPGHPVVVEVLQLGADVVLAATSGAGETVGVDRPTGIRGPESLLLESTGSASVRVELPGGEPGAYRLSFETLDPASPDFDRRLEAERHLTRAGHLLVTDRAGNNAQIVEHLEAASAVLDADRSARSLAWTLVFLAAETSLDQRPELYRRAGDLFRGLADSGAEAMALNGEGLSFNRLHRGAEAVVLFERARELSGAVGDRSLEATILNNLCLTHQYEGQWRRAAACFEDAVEIARSLGDPSALANVLNNLGGSHEKLGQLGTAIGFFRQASEIAHREGDTYLEGKVLNNLGYAYDLSGRSDEALAALTRSREILRTRRDAQWYGRVLNNLGGLYRRLGETGRARGYFEEALELRRTVGDARGEAATENQLATLAQSEDDLAAAAAGFERALALARAAKDGSLEILAQTRLGRVQSLLGDRAAAVVTLEQAVATARETSDRYGLALALQTRAQVSLEAGDPASALEPLDEALDLFRTSSLPIGELATLNNLGEAELALGRTDRALARLDEAIGLLESLRIEVASPELRAAFGASRRSAYELAIEAHMVRERERAGAGAAAALRVSEQARARYLLDLLHGARMEADSEAAPEMLERRRSLSLRLRALAARQVELLARSGPTRSGDLVTMETEVAEVLEQMDVVEAELRRQNPRRALLEDPRLLDGPHIQALLDDGTLLLEYALGEERSYLWAVGQDLLEVFELPGRESLEALARTVYRQLAERSVGESAAEELARRRELSDAVLAPVSHLLGERRLVVVPDGALGYLPFAALPSPGTDRPLLERHEVLSLPSASVLAALREARRASRGQAGRVAVVADPVFSASDPRVTRGPSGDAVATAGDRPDPDPERALPQAGDGADTDGFARLPATRSEAEAIASLVPAERLHMVLDFASNRGDVLATDWRPYDLIHFATHGVIHAETPALSGLVLSLVDEDGAARPGFLSLADIYDLELEAELVVLSGCETALGRELRGEGLLGLTQGFFHAGAEGLAVSLWRVRDRATAELMARFYHALLEEGLSPSAALTSAQRTIARERRWRDPYYWAPFVYQGDWTMDRTAR
jgi:CHAT domain-containing protein/Tfp pilus assembly protein PilF